MIVDQIITVIVDQSITVIVDQSITVIVDLSITVIVDQSITVIVDQSITVIVDLSITVSLAESPAQTIQVFSKLGLGCRFASTGLGACKHSHNKNLKSKPFTHHYHHRTLPPSFVICHRWFGTPLQIARF